MRTANPELQEQRRRQILRAAGQCFAEKGFHQASMAEIAKAAGLSMGLLYRYFANKDALVMAFAELSRAVVNEDRTAYYIADTKNAAPDWQPIHPKARAAFNVPPSPYYVVRYHFLKACKALGLKKTIHKLRHGTATAILSGGGSLKDVQVALNHKSAQSAMRYSHFVQEIKVKALSYIGKRA